MEPKEIDVVKENFENAVKLDLFVPGVEYGSIDPSRYFTMRVAQGIYDWDSIIEEMYYYDTKYCEVTDFPGLED